MDYFNEAKRLARIADPNPKTLPVGPDFVDVTMTATVRLCVQVDCVPKTTYVISRLILATDNRCLGTGADVAGILLVIPETKCITCTRNIIGAACDDWRDEIETKWTLWCREHSEVAAMEGVQMDRDVQEPQGQEDVER